MLSFPSSSSLFLFLLLLLSSAPEANARAIGWYHVFHHADRDSPLYDSPATPTPTPAPTTTTVISAAVVTSPPPVQAVELMMKRQKDDKICGYVQGSSDRPFICGGDSVCVFRSRTSAVGCCSGIPCSEDIATACIDYAGCQRGLCKTLTSGTMACNLSNFPYCLAYTFRDIGSTMVQCVDRSTDAGLQEMMFTPLVMNVVKAPTSTSKIGWFSSRVGSSMSQMTSSSSTSSSTTATGIVSSGTASTQTQPQTQSPTQTPESSTVKRSGEGGLSTEALIGVVSGSVAALGVIAGVYQAWRVWKARREARRGVSL